MDSRKTILKIASIVVNLVMISVVVILIIRGAQTAYNYGYKIFAQEPVAGNGPARSVTVTIGEEDSVSDIARMLEDKGLIEDRYLFRIQEFFSDHESILPGTYELTTAMTSEEMLGLMSTAPVQAQEGTSELEGDTADGTSSDGEEGEESAASEEVTVDNLGDGAWEGSEGTDTQEEGGMGEEGDGEDGE